MPRRLLAATTLLGITLSAGVLTAFTRDPDVVIRTAERVRIARAGGALLGDAGVVRQRTPTDCGPAALANLLAQVGTRVPLDTLARLARTGPRGTRLGDLAAAATQLGHPARAVRVPRDSSARFLRAAALPLIAWIDRRHFVTVVARGEDGQLLTLDSQIGAYTLPPDAFAARWTGEAMLLE